MLGSASAAPGGFGTLLASDIGLSRGISGWLVRVIPTALRGPATGPGSWREFGACGSPPADFTGERNVDSPLFGGLEIGTTLQEGNLAM